MILLSARSISRNLYYMALPLTSTGRQPHYLLSKVSNTAVGVCVRWIAAGQSLAPYPDWVRFVFSSGGRVSKQLKGARPILKV
jgi:hypothetical protein